MEPLLSADQFEQQNGPRKLRYRAGMSNLQKFFFGWARPLMSYSSDNSLSVDVLQELSAQEQSQSVYYKWNDYWNEQKATNTKDPLYQSIKKTYQGAWVIAFIFDFLAYTSTIVIPLLVYSFANYLTSANFSAGIDVMYLIVIPFVRFTRSFFDGHGLFLDNIIGAQMSNSVTIGMVNKAMKYSVLCNKSFKLGEISSLVQVDCFRLSLLPKSLNAVICICWCLIFGIVFMAVIVSYSFLAGFAVLFIISFLNIVISKFTAKNTQQFAKATDERMKVTNEIFNNIKFIKVNAWEEYFYDKLMKRRTTQVYWLRKKFMSEAAATFTMWLAPKFILLCTYALYTQVGNDLSPAVTFSIMSLYAYIQFYLQTLPNALSVVIECQNALKRIQNFMLAEEINLSCITYDRFDLPSSSAKENAIEVHNGSFFWDKDDESGNKDLAPRQPVMNLVDMNFTIKRGEFVAVVGGIGAGKSSLMYSLLGEMKFKDIQRPRVSINGSLSLVTQKPWIVNDTVRNNIIFGERFDAIKYKQVVKYACLERDFELFTHGDQTMIGQKGATLSGGQKARISFARALYSNADILMLDDLLSAVDVHVGKFMMTDTLMGFCKQKTRILITHALYYLKYVDKIFMMEDGHIVEQGNYEYIKNTSRFKEMNNAMMKDEKKKRSTTIKIAPLEPEKDGEYLPEGNIEDQMENQIIREASVHTKRSKANSAVDRNKLQAFRQRKSKMSNLPKIEVKEEAGKFRMPSKKDVRVQVKVEAKPQPKKAETNQNELMMAEEVSNVSVLKLYGSYVKYNLGWGYMLIIIIIQIIWAACNAMTNLWLVFWCDSYAPGTKLTYSLDFYIVGFIIFGFLYAFVAFIRALLIANSSPKMSDFIHESMVSNLLFSSLNQFFDRVPLGRIFNRLSKDLNSVDMNVSVALNGTLVFCFFLAAVIVTICVCGMYYIFLPIIVVYIGSCHFLRIYYSKAASELTKIEGITKSPIVSCFTEILSGVATIRSYKKESMFILKNCMKIDQNKKPIMARKAVEVWFTLRLMLLSYMMTYSGLAYALFWPSNGDTPADIYSKASSGTLLVVTCLGFDQIMYFLFSNLAVLDSQLISIERCQSFMDLQPEAGYVQYLKNREELKVKSKERRMIKAEGWPDKGRIDFIDLKCRYRKNLDLVLRGLNVTFTGGHKIGIVGRTGSGKSTIMLCLLRILEADDGKIMLDGRDISQLSLDDLRSKITIILQDACLFAGTLRENLDPLGEYADQQLSRALQLCALKEMVDSRQGLQTSISENGENLSAGERQLISICRAILKPTKIVLVDEATANIDVKTQSIIYKAMNQGFKHSTVITVAHRLNTVINSDRILVLQGGLLKEYDNPQELLKNPNSFFAQLYNESLKENKM